MSKLKKVRYLAPSTFGITSEVGIVVICGTPKAGRTTVRRALQRKLLEDWGTPSITISTREPCEVEPGSVDYFFAGSHVVQASRNKEFMDVVAAALREWKVVFLDVSVNEAEQLKDGAFPDASYLFVWASSFELHRRHEEQGLARDATVACVDIAFHERRMASHIFGDHEIVKNDEPLFTHGMPTEACATLVETAWQSVLQKMSKWIFLAKRPRRQPVEETRAIQLSFEE